MAPGTFAKKIKILGGQSVPPSSGEARASVRHPSKIIKPNTPLGESGSSSIISRRRQPIRVQFGEGAS